MREEIETEKSLTQLKSFIVREMKSQSVDWMETKIGHNYVKDEEGFKSKKEMLAYRWETFLGKNKVLNRDRKIDEILK